MHVFFSLNATLSCFRTHPTPVAGIFSTAKLSEVVEHSITSFALDKIPTNVNIVIGRYSEFTPRLNNSRRHGYLSSPALMWWKHDTQVKFQYPISTAHAQRSAEMRINDMSIWECYWDHFKTSLNLFFRCSMMRYVIFQPAAKRTSTLMGKLHTSSSQRCCEGVEVSALMIPVRSSTPNWENVFMEWFLCTRALSCGTNTNCWDKGCHRCYHHVL